MASDVRELSLEEQVIKLKRYVSALHQSWQQVRIEIRSISERLRLATSHRDPRAHSRAYHDLSSLVRKELQKVPEKQPEFPLFEKPKAVAATIKRMLKGDSPIPIVNVAGTIFMGCFSCDEWIDITPLFAERKFDWRYECPQGHPVYFAGGKKFKREEV